MTKIPSVEERVEELGLCECEDLSGELQTDRITQALTADRTALLTELREWVEIKKLDATVMNVANRKRAGHINRTLVEVKAHINNLINPDNL